MYNRKVVQNIVQTMLDYPITIKNLVGNNNEHIDH